MLDIPKKGKEPPINMQPCSFQRTREKRQASKQEPSGVSRPKNFGNFGERKHEHLSSISFLFGQWQAEAGVGIGDTLELGFCGWIMQLHAALRVTWLLGRKEVLVLLFGMPAQTAELGVLPSCHVWEVRIWGPLFKQCSVLSTSTPNNCLSLRILNLTECHRLFYWWKENFGSVHCRQETGELMDPSWGPACEEGLSFRRTLQGSHATPTHVKPHNSFEPDYFPGHCMSTIMPYELWPLKKA